MEHRTREGSGCPYPECSPTPRSEWEIFLSFELTQFFEIDPDDQTIVGPSRKTLKVDIKIPEERLVVEFDGAYWRRGCEERDAGKSRSLHQAGWKVVRVRDHGLGRIAPTDVRVDTRRMSHKEIANRTLEKLYALLGRDKAGLRDYLAQPDVANQAQAAAYIQQLKERKRQRGQGA